MEGFKLYGPKSNTLPHSNTFVELKEIADHVKTRTVVQVRSHLQKHLIKESKKSQLPQQVPF